MPVNKITSTKRGKAAIAATLIAAATGSWGAYKAAQPPTAVVLAVDALIKPWEGLVLSSHWDQFAKIYDICYGETRINGKPVGPGMTRTPAQCQDMLVTRVQRDYYAPLTKCIAEFEKKPVSVQASAISGAYNFGVNGMCNSTAARFIRVGRYREACEAQTAWNRAGGQVVGGLVKRREMGDAQRIGEAELCVSGI
jgi:lysozyme